MSSSEAYLDSLLDSILGGGKPDGEEEAVSGAEGGDNQTTPVDGGKAMSSEEIEEMLVSMGTLGGTEDESKDADASETEDMEAMLAFMNEHNTVVSDPEETGEGMEDGLSLDDSDLDGMDFDETDLADLPLDIPGMDEGVASDDFSLEEPEEEEGMTGGPDGLSLDDLDLDDLSLDDLSLDDLGMDDSASSDGFALEETEAGEDMSGGLDGLSLDDLDLGEADLDDLSLDGLSLDDLGMDDSASSDGFALEETETGEDMSGSVDGFSFDDPGEGSADETAFDGLSLDDLDLGASGGDAAVSDDFSLDDLALEESDDAAGGMDELMSEEDIDRLLNGDLSDGESGVDDFALEETGESDEDLSALLAGMDHDEDLSEINDLLEGADQGVSPDDDMLAMLEGVGDDDSSFDLFENEEAAREAESIRELTPEEIEAREGGGKRKKEKKRRKKLFGKKKKEDSEEVVVEDAGDELEALLAQTTEPEAEIEEVKEKEKKPGAFARLMAFLLESDEEDEDPLAAEVLADGDGELGMVTDENKALLEELKEEDKKGKKKKKKDKKKGKKGKEGEEGEEAAEGEEEESKKVKKKKKKEKKKKDEEEVDLFAPPEKKLSKKKVITVFVFCGTIAACIILLSSFLPVYMEKREAQAAYDHQNYAEVYDLLYGKELNEQDEILYQRSNLILQMDRKLSSYENYSSLDMRLESLNALISGVERYQEILIEAETYNVAGEVREIYEQILERLSADFGVSEQDALEIIAVEDDVTYSQRLEAIISGAAYGEDVPAGRQDVLPEEEEIIERIDGLETETAEEQPADIQEDVTPEEDILPEEMMDGPEPLDENADVEMPADENADEGAE